MAGFSESSRDPIYMDDIGLERLSQPLSLKSVDPYDSMYTPSKTSSYQVIERPSEADKGIKEQDRFSLLPKHRVFNNSGSTNGAVGQSHIYWRYPTFMVLSFLAGLILAVGHHVYYRWLDGQPVGSVAQQQWSLRIGNGFAITVSFLLKIAVGIAYIQYLWRTLRRSSLSLKTLNDAFGISSNVFSFFNWELVSTVRIGAVLAFIFWAMPLTSLFAPATLSVTRSLSSSSASTEVFNIGISNSSLQKEFVYSERDDLPALGASSRLARIIGAVAMTGQRQDLQPPTSQANVSYELQAYVPLLRCDAANTTVQSQVISMLMGLSGGGTSPFSYAMTPSSFNNQTFHMQINMTDGELQAKGDVGYFGLVPTLQHEGSTTNYTLTPWWNSTDTGTMELFTLFGELWIAIPKAPISSSNDTSMEFVTCQLYNSSLTFKVDFTDHVSNTTIIENKWMNDLNRLTTDTDDVESYFAYFQEMSTFIVGSVSWWIDTLGAAYYFPSAEVLDTNLATSAQVYYMDQRIMEEADVQNQTYSQEQVRNISFAQDIENFALNASLSLLSDVTLCNTVLANVTTTSTETVYLYESMNLILVYSFVLGTSLIAVLIGSFAFHSNGVGYDAHVSTFAVTMQNTEVKEVLKSHSTGLQPLNKSLGRLKLRFAGSDGFVRGDSSGNYPR